MLIVDVRAPYVPVPTVMAVSTTAKSWFARENLVQSLLTDMPKGRVTEIVSQTRHFHDLNIKTMELGRFRLLL